jgi:hypothetical protein
VKQRLIREGDELADDESVVVRGGELNASDLRADATRHQVIYGTYGVSVFAIRDTTFDELAQQSPLVRFELLTLITAGVLRGASLRLEPTGRNSRHFTIAFDDLEDGVARLCGCEHQVRVNPYHEC